MNCGLKRHHNGLVVRSTPPCTDQFPSQAPHPALQRLMEEPPTAKHLRLKAGTAVATVAVTLGLLLFDWDLATGGHQTVFSGVRPAVKAALNRLYGRGGQPERQQSSSSDRGSSSSSAPGS